MQQPLVLLNISLLALAAGMNSLRAAEPANVVPKATYVIVHGAWAGGWAFKRVDELLTADGYKVYRPTLTGLGERIHLASTNIDLDTHIQDVVNVIRYEDLHDIVLVGHSYGGMVITGVADRVPERIKHLIYVDAFLPTNGESLYDTLGPAAGRSRSFYVVSNGFAFLRGYNPDKPPPAEAPQPDKTFSQPISLKSQQAVRKVPATYILTVDPGHAPQQDTFYRFYERARTRGWTVLTMESDHNVQWTHPNELASLLEKVPSIPTTAPRRTDANGNPIRRAPTGHISNYAEARVGTYELPDPLVLQNGQPVNDADTWFKERRPEILKLYQTEIYGRVPTNAPKVTWEVTETDSNALDGAAIRKEIVGHFGDQPDGPAVHVHLYLPAKATTPVPVFLHLTFFGGVPLSATPTNASRPRFSEAGPIKDILAHGYGYATLRYSEIQPDSRNTYQSGVIGMALAADETKPALDEWGSISAWAWGASRVLDYFETDPSVDARRVGLIGHSRLGKTVLWAGAQDPRFAIIFSSCSGEMGAALARRDYGETVDDMAFNFPWQFAGNFQKYAGHWNEMPVDAHLLIALSAPRPVFITGGTQDQWADPHGEFLAEVAAGPVYRLLGEQDLGTKELPPLDTALIQGNLGFRYHTGGHTITDGDWKAFLEFADLHLKPAY